jgi:uncharacterized protein YecE (DUF72 family)
VIGTSGWTYDSWRGPFYPAGCAKKGWLRHYAEIFPSAEINGSFYCTPSLEAVQSWREQTPNDFLFAWKASKYITHWKRLTEKCDNSLELMETRLQVLGPKVAAVLFQLPPQFTCNGDRLAHFLSMLSTRWRYAFEFRHPSWYSDAIFTLLHQHDIALCISDHADAPSPWEVTADYVYVRGHGPRGNYAGSYSDRTLRRWADAVETWQADGKDVLVYFDNDQKAAAPKDALRLMRRLGRDIGKGKARQPRSAVAHHVAP